MLHKMFTSLKNKIKEETGSDVPRLFQIKQRSPNHESISSVGSTLSSDEGHVTPPIDQIQANSANREKEIIDKLEKQHNQELEERDREWQEKITSLQNNMHAAQAVWCGEAAAARREAREEVRNNTKLTEQLNTTLDNTTRLQNKLDQLMEDIETERRGWALERQRLAAEVEDALHRLSLAAPYSSAADDISSDGSSSQEAALRRKLEEAQLHLHDIKTSWSGQIAALETQVGRLSRQAGEEGAERRRIEKERDALLERLREKDIQLEQAQATLEDRDAKMALLAAEAGEASRCGRTARSEAQQHRQTADSLADKLLETERSLLQCQDNINTLHAENNSLKSNLSLEKKSVQNLNTKLDSLRLEKDDWEISKDKLEKELDNYMTIVKQAEEAMESETNRIEKLAKENDEIKSEYEHIRHELNNIHERYDKERREKEECLMRNAHMSQTLEIYRQEMRQQEVEIVDLKGRIKHLENTISQHSEEQNKMQTFHETENKHQTEIAKLKSEKEAMIISEKQLHESIKDLNVQLCEKTKNMRILQNRLTDMKKTLQRELRGGQVDPLGSSVVEGTSEDPDITTKYLKHVLIKFLTCREVEARHLPRALAALLDLTPQEEALLRDTISRRNTFTSWLNPSSKYPFS